MTKRRRSRWGEFIEARDSVLFVLGMPQAPSRLLGAGETVGEALLTPVLKRDQPTVHALKLADNFG